MFGKCFYGSLNRFEIWDNVVELNIIFSQKFAKVGLVFHAQSLEVGASALQNTHFCYMSFFYKICANDAAN